VNVLFIRRKRTVTVGQRYTRVCLRRGGDLYTRENKKIIGSEIRKQNNRRPETSGGGDDVCRMLVI